MSKNDRLIWSLEQIIEYVKKLDRELERGFVDDFRASLAFAKRIELRDRLQERIDVDSDMRIFVHSIAHNQWPSEFHFNNDLVAHWYNLLEIHCGLYERPADETRCNDACLHTHRSLMRLSSYVDRDGVLRQSSELYGCVQHGTIHYCQKRGCALKLTTLTHMHICLFSGYEIGREFSQVASIGAEYRQGSSRAAFLSRTAHAEAAEGGVDTFDSSAVQSRSTYAELLRKIENGEEITVRPSSHDENGRTRLATAAQTRSFRFDSFISSKAEEAETKLVATATEIIDDILFNKETRDLINIQRTEECKRLGNDRLRDYHRRQRSAKLFSDVVSAATEYSTPFRSLVLLPLVEMRDSTYRRASFVRLCISLWKLCHRVRAPDTVICTFVQFCLAVLFMQRTGYSVARRDESGFVAAPRRFTFVPLDKRLIVDLPDEKQVDMFGKRSTEELRNHITSTDASAVVGFGTGTATAQTTDKERRKSLFKEDRYLKRRKAKVKVRQTAVVTGTKQMTMQSTASGPRMSVRESDALPAFLHSSVVGNRGAYEMADIIAGRNYLHACIAAIEPAHIEAESRTLSF